MQKWTRWQDWAAAVVGLYALLSPIWTETTTRASWTMVVLGVVTILVAQASLAMPGNVVSEGAVAVLGVLFFIAPWVMGFSGTTGMAVTAWIVGIITAGVGLLALPESNRIHSQVASTR